MDYSGIWIAVFRRVFSATLCNNSMSHDHDRGVVVALVAQYYHVIYYVFKVTNIFVEKKSQIYVDDSGHFGGGEDGVNQLLNDRAAARVHPTPALVARGPCLAVHISTVKGTSALLLCRRISIHIFYK